MKVAALAGERVDAVVLVDVAGRVDRGVAGPVAASIRRLGRAYESADHYLTEVRSQGLIDPWTEYWERAYRYDLCEVDGGVRPGTSLLAVLEDRAHTATQDPYERWKHLTMPTLLVRATQELRPGAGFVVPADDRDRFLRAVPHAVIAEVDANHLTINTHADTAAAIRDFLGRSMPPKTSPTCEMHRGDRGGQTVALATRVPQGPAVSLRTIRRRVLLRRRSWSGSVRRPATS